MTDNPTASNSAPIESKPTRPSWFSGCLTILAVLFIIQGIWQLFFGSVFSYIFLATGMLSSATLLLLLTMLGSCILYFLLAFRLKHQHWLISVTFLAFVWLVLPLPRPYLINSATMRIRNDGFAMMPTLPNGAYMIANRQAYQRQLPQRGDVVLLQYPASDSARMLVKRIIGLPGEVVTIDNGQVSIDGTPLNEPYISAPPAYQGEWTISEGQYFVLGDNRPDSIDSHQFGAIPRENILGKAVWIYWPLSNFGEIAGSNFPP
jgi:signal peptidase I